MISCKWCKCLVEKAGPYKDFCSKNCYNRNRYRISSIEITCEKCGKIFSRHKSGKSKLCRVCRQVGIKSAQWRGGFKTWRIGRYGRDKDGLSWKIQRRLTWERDNYTCQHCGISPITEKNPKYKPDCHHVVPYRTSFSHALANLISLCRKCHLKEDSKENSPWEGTIPFIPSKKIKIPCKECGSKRRKLNEDGYCGDCFILKVLVPKIAELKGSGKTQQQISKELGITQQRISRYYIKYIRTS